MNINISKYSLLCIQPRACCKNVVEDKFTSVKMGMLIFTTFGSKKEKVCVNMGVLKLTILRSLDRSLMWDYYVTALR